MNDFILGFNLLACVIIGFGPQNSYVLQDGLVCRKNRLLVPLLCILCDTSLILISSYVIGSNIKNLNLNLEHLKLFAQGFLLFYAGLSLKKFFFIKEAQDLKVNLNEETSSWKIRTLSVLGFSLLNPYTYIDIFFILGLACAANPLINKNYFSMGAISCSIVWSVFLSAFAGAIGKLPNKNFIDKALSLVIAGSCVAACLSLS